MSIPRTPSIRNLEDWIQANVIEAKKETSEPNIEQDLKKINEVVEAAMQKSRAIGPLWKEAKKNHSSEELKKHFEVLYEGQQVLSGFFLE